MLQQRKQLYDHYDHDNIDAMQRAYEAIVKDLEIPGTHAFESPNAYTWGATFLCNTISLDDLVRVAESNGYDVIDGIRGTDCEWQAEFISVAARALNGRFSEDSSYDSGGQARRIRTLAAHEAGHIIVGLHEPGLAPRGWSVVTKPARSQFDARAEFAGHPATPTAALRIALAGPVAEAMWRGQDPRRAFFRRVRKARIAHGPTDEAYFVALSLLLKGEVEVASPGLYVPPRVTSQRVNEIANDVWGGRFQDDFAAVIGALRASASVWRRLGDAIAGAFHAGAVLHDHDILLGIEPLTWAGPDGWKRATEAWGCPGAPYQLALPGERS